MAQIAVSTALAGKLRPLNIVTDLMAVADLIELCFADSMGLEGRSFLDNMRRNASLNWAPRMMDSLSVPLGGFVWEENRRIVGHVSLIPFFKGGRKIYLIANVATHPEYRRQGIARRLTEAAMQSACKKYADGLWLHVRDDNPGALHLYQSLGFQERARRAQWKKPHPGTASYPEPLSGVAIARRAHPDWSRQLEWLDQSYPPQLAWYFQQSLKILQPGLWGEIQRFFSEDDFNQWAVHRAGELKAVAAVQKPYADHTGHLWLATPRRPDFDALTALLLYVCRRVPYALSMDVPVGPADEAIRAAGFHHTRTLVWMQAPGATPTG